VIYPGTYDIIITQNSTWKEVFRLSDSIRRVTLDAATATFTSNCHKLVENDKVYFTPLDASGTLPCGIEAASVYYVINSGLTNDTFKVSASLGGTSVAPHGVVTASFSCSKPLNLVGFVVDAEITDMFSNETVQNITTSLPNASNGLVELSLTPASTLGLIEGTYTYDSSLTSPSGERYYWISGAVTVQKTFSRN
jgi:hypothetical protein